MSTSGDAAEQVVRMSLEGVETIAKITGKGAEDLAKLLIAEMKKPQRTKGRASLMTLLKQKKPIRVFELDDKSLRTFCKEAKKYGVMYHVLKDKSKNNGFCDIMVRAEDASKVNRIFQRFQLSANNQAEIRNGVERTVDESKQVPERTTPEKTAEDKFIDELFKPPQKEKTQNDNPSQAKTERSRPSEPTSGTRKDQRDRTRDDPERRPSVRKQLEEYKRQQKKTKQTQEPTRTKSKKKSKGSKSYGRS